MKARAAALLLVVSASAAGCRRNDSDLADKIHDIDERLATIEKGIDEGKAPVRGPVIKEADPSATYAVPIEDAPRLGPEHAPVTMVIGCEFAASQCRHMEDVVAALRKRYGDDLAVVYKNYVVHPAAGMPPAVAACAAERQGKYEAMARLIWTKAFDGDRDLSVTKMEALAGEAGLDMARYRADVSGTDCVSRVRNDQRELARVGARGTPTTYINGRYLRGAVAAGEFEALIDEELALAKDRIAKGTPAETYYQQWVIGKGIKRL